MTIDEFKTKLKTLQLSLKDFAALVDIPYSTISKYGRSTPIPPWINPFLDLYEQNKNMENIKQEIKSLAQKL